MRHRISLLSTAALLFCATTSPAPAAAVLQAISPQTVAIQPAGGVVQPIATLAGAYTGACTAHPCVLTTMAQAATFMTEALATKTGTASGQYAALTKVGADTGNYLASANSANLALLETPTTGTDMPTYMNLFSVYDSDPTTNSGAASAAMTLAEYWLFYTASGGTWGTLALATQAKAAANAILVNYAQHGFVDSTGAALVDFHQFTPANATTWESVPLQIGRGMQEYIIAADILHDGTSPDQIAVDNFITRMTNILIGAMAVHYAEATYRDTRTENQTTGSYTTILYSARYLGNGNLMKAIAGDQTVPTPLKMSWPQLVDGDIFGYGENEIESQPAQAGNIFYNPQVSIGEITDRFRGPAHDCWGYPAGNLTNLMLAAIVLAEAGYQPYTFIGPKGQSLEAALDFYAQYNTQYISLTDQTLISNDGIVLPDKQFYIGTMFGANGQTCTTDSTTGVKTCTPTQGATVQAGALPFTLGAQAYPGDALISATIAQITSVANAGNVPNRTIDRFSLLAWR